MIESGTLQCFDLTLTTQGLLHVGDGKIIPKKFYMLNGNTISYIDEERLFAILLRRNQLERFEAYCLGADTDLGRFFKSIALSPAEQHALVRCTFRSADALDENHSCKEIRPFIRNTANQVYVPGSSIKGALRTALLFSMIQQDGSKKPLLIGRSQGALLKHVISINCIRRLSAIHRRKTFYADFLFPTVKSSQTVPCV